FPIASGYDVRGHVCVGRAESNQLTNKPEQMSVAKCSALLESLHYCPFSPLTPSMAMSFPEISFRPALNLSWQTRNHEGRHYRDSHREGPVPSGTGARCC